MELLSLSLGSHFFFWSFLSLSAALFLSGPALCIPDGVLPMSAWSDVSLARCALVHWLYNTCAFPECCMITTSGRYAWIASSSFSSGFPKRNKVQHGYDFEIPANE